MILGMASKPDQRKVGRPSKYAEDVRQRAVALMLDASLSIKAIVAETGIPVGTLYRWVANETKGHTAGHETAGDPRQ